MTMTRIAIITGAASGIGRARAGELARRGPGTATSAVVDVGDAGTVRALVDQVRDQYGRLDVMANNAGIGVGGGADELTLAHWERVISAQPSPPTRQPGRPDTAPRPHIGGSGAGGSSGMGGGCGCPNAASAADMAP